MVSPTKVIFYIVPLIEFDDSLNLTFYNPVFSTTESKHFLNESKTVLRLTGRSADIHLGFIGSCTLLGQWDNLEKELEVLVHPVENGKFINYITKLKTCNTAKESLLSFFYKNQISITKYSAIIINDKSVNIKTRETKRIYRKS